MVHKGARMSMVWWNHLHVVGKASLRGSWRPNRYRLFPCVSHGSQIFKSPVRVLEIQSWLIFPSWCKPFQSRGTLTGKITIGGSSTPLTCTTTESKSYKSKTLARRQTFLLKVRHYRNRALTFVQNHTGQKHSLPSAGFSSLSATHR